MRIVVAAIGRLKQGSETELSERYRKRTIQTGRQLGLRDVEIIEIRESRAADSGKRMLEELIALANVIPQNAAVVLLDSRGKISTALVLRPSSPNGGPMADRPLRF